MKRLKTIAVFAVVVLAATVAPAQRRGTRPGPGGQLPPPMGPPMRQDQDRQREHRPPVMHGPGPHMGDWLRQHENMPADQQEKALENDPTFRALPPDRQERLRQRLKNFNTMPQDQRDRLLQRMEIFEHLSPEQQQRTRDMFRRFRELPPDRRRALVEGFRGLQDLSPADRQKILDSSDYRRNFSDEERELMRGMGELGLPPAGPARPQ